ncbi:MAG: hypothetical protein HFJ22_05390 [Clostridia bacterium]|jgi:Kef-type K+ transport system membrane component KefB|nr:hypothetical protein [Clostridia bacterium]
MSSFFQNDEKDKVAFDQREKVIKRRAILIVIMLIVVIIAIVFIILDSILWHTGVVTALSSVISLIHTSLSIVCIVRDQIKSSKNEGDDK